jgi:hypothetical protein
MRIRTNHKDELKFNHSYYKLFTRFTDVLRKGLYDAELGRIVWIESNRRYSSF